MLWQSLDGTDQESSGREGSKAGWVGDWQARHLPELQAMTTHESAVLLGIKARSVVWAIKRGYIKAEKRGRDYWIEDAEVERYRRERKPAHRPKDDLVPPPGIEPRHPL